MSGTKIATLRSRLTIWLLIVSVATASLGLLATVIRYLTGGAMSAQSWVDGRAHTVADTLARRVVHDSLDAHRHDYRRYVSRSR